MNPPLHALLTSWSSRKPGEPYSAVEDFAEEVGDLWPYAVVHDQIESGWSDDRFTGALALNLARSYKPVLHAVAAFVTLASKWPVDNATTALNLLALTHRVPSSPHPWLDRLLGHVALRCLNEGLRDPRPVVFEEAANVLGGLSPHHFLVATPNDIGVLRDLASRVLDRIDQSDVVALLEQRVRTVLDALPTSEVLTEVDAHRTLRELDTYWPKIAPKKKDAEHLATLRTHVNALVWKFESADQQAIQSVYVYSVDGKNKAPDRGWAVIAPWLSTVRSLLKDQVQSPKRQELAFNAIGATSGSLLVTYQVETKEPLQGSMTRMLERAKIMSHTELDSELDSLRALLRQQKLGIRVAHVEADGGAASISIVPDGDEPVTIPYSSRKLTTKDIPQANELERVFALVDRAANGDTITPEAIGVTAERQVQYYKAAARILDLMTASGEVTRMGWLLHVAADGEDKYRRVRAAFEACPCGQAWLEWAAVAKLSDVPAESGEAFLAERSELTGDTVGRRANTLNVWLAKLRSY